MRLHPSTQLLSETKEASSTTAYDFYRLSIQNQKYFIGSQIDFEWLTLSLSACNLLIYPDTLVI